eukprot:3110120-Pyramimonas_sp.AAC.1
MRTSETLEVFSSERARRKGERHMWKRNRPQSVTSCKCLKRMCAALRREPHFENDLPSIREFNVSTNVRGASARATV